ncbi:hypothetical protein [Streptomyces sp. NPDC058644]|uniref:hypothetical protein n=1 Tax=unclassified Streptomyces TaxID=2593676 RepID=UPI00365C19EB
MLDLTALTHCDTGGPFTLYERDKVILKDQAEASADEAHEEWAVCRTRLGG